MLQSMKFKELTGVLKTAAKGWKNDHASQRSAALAYYSIFSLAPILLIVISVAGFFFGEDAAQGAVRAELSSTIGAEATTMLDSMAEAVKKSGKSKLMTAVGLAILAFSASGVFFHLKRALNAIWGVEEKPQKKVLSFIKARALSFLLVLFMGFLLIVSLLLSTAVSAASGWLSLPDWGLHGLDLAISLGIMTVLFSMLLKILPDVNIAWCDVWIGAFVTAILFSIGKLALALYLGREETFSIFGAAGAFILVLLWVFYTFNILFFGSEITQAYTKSKER